MCSLGFAESGGERPSPRARSRAVLLHIPLEKDGLAALLVTPALLLPVRVKSTHTECSSIFYFTRNRPAGSVTRLLASEAGTGRAGLGRCELVKCWARAGTNPPWSHGWAQAGATHGRDHSDRLERVGSIFRDIPSLHPAKERSGARRRRARLWFYTAVKNTKCHLISVYRFTQ